MAVRLESRDRSKSEKEGSIPHLILTQIENKFLFPQQEFLIR